MNFWDEHWLKLNKRAHKKWLSYFSVVAMPFYIGLFLGFLATSLPYGALSTFWVVIGFLVVGLFTYLGIRSDIKNSIYSAIHSLYLAKRDKLIKEWNEEAEVRD